MPERRVELLHPCGHKNLNLACLPIPPPRQGIHNPSSGKPERAGSGSERWENPSLMSTTSRNMPAPGMGNYGVHSLNQRHATFLEFLSTSTGTRIVSTNICILFLKRCAFDGPIRSDALPIFAAIGLNAQLPYARWRKTSRILEKGEKTIQDFGNDFFYFHQ